MPRCAGLQAGRRSAGQFRPAAAPAHFRRWQHALLVGEAARATAGIRQNLAFAVVYNAGHPLGAGLLYPFTGQLLSPMIAALAMSLS